MLKEMLKNVYKQCVTNVCIIKSEFFRIRFVYEYFAVIAYIGNIYPYH